VEQAADRIRQQHTAGDPRRRTKRPFQEAAACLRRRAAAPRSALRLPVTARLPVTLLLAIATLSVTRRTALRAAAPTRGRHGRRRRAAIGATAAEQRAKTAKETARALLATLTLKLADMLL
jgi:hypothetical protein